MEDEPVLNADNLLSRTFPTRVLHNLLPTGTEDLLFRDSATDYVHNWVRIEAAPQPENKLVQISFFYDVN